MLQDHNNVFSIAGKKRLKRRGREDFHYLYLCTKHKLIQGPVE